MGKNEKTGLMSGYELVTVPGSNLFSLDDYIKKYLKTHPELSIGTQLKIILRELLTRDIVEQLNLLKKNLQVRSFECPN